MKCIIVGLGVQGNKRRKIAGDECVVSVDPFHELADYALVQEVPLDSYDSALVCTPDQNKLEIINYLLNQKKNVLVEKPLFAENCAEIQKLNELAKLQEVTLYTAYNHRFEPHLVKAKEVIENGQLGKLYTLRMFYGNGTAADVKESPWRDQGQGVLSDIGSHLIDTLLFLFGNEISVEKLINIQNFENNSPDSVVFSAHSNNTYIECEATLLSWRNTFRFDLLGEKGSLHIDSLCKWGPSTLTLRERKLPSGRPSEKQSVLICDDPTWQAEYNFFKDLVKKAICNTENDILIQKNLDHLFSQAGTI